MARYKIDMSLIIVLFEISMIIVILAIVFGRFHHYDKLHIAEKNRFDMMEMADKLRQSSDDMTHFARTYAVTGDKRYKRQYFDTLQIREGGLARPLNYTGIYWDLAEDIREQRHPDTIYVSLKTLMSSLPYTPEELALLKKSETSANILVDKEVGAFEQIIEHKNYKKAMEILHGSSYYSAKSDIMDPIDTFITLLNSRTKREIDDIYDTVQLYYYAIILALILFVVVNVMLYFFLDRQRSILILKEKTIEQQSRLAQMGEMISMIAHQWRQPLAAISSTSGAISIKAQQDKLDSSTAIKLSDNISQYSQHLSTTIDDFRNFFKADKQMAKTTYTEIVDSILGIIESSILSQEIEIDKVLNSTVVFDTYANETKQVVLNLIKNAEDVLIEKETKNPKISIHTVGNVLTIRDNAGGIPDSIIDRIFDPYFSTKTKKDGTGLGLYMSKTIIEDHCGGELSVYNDTDGAVFTIKLP